MFRLFKFKLILFLLFLIVKAQSIYDVHESRKGDINLVPQNSDFKFSTIDLKKVDSVNTVLNKIILRRKFSVLDYSFYEGKTESEYFADLERFIPNVPIEELLRKKFYKRANDNPDNDIINVYFYNKSIYVENVAKIYYYENGWQKLDLYKKDFAPVTFLSYPDSVFVYIDDVNYGTTPLVLKELMPGIRTVKYKKENYYCYEFLIRKSVDIPILKRIIMQEMPVSPIGTYMDPESFSHGSIESVNLLIETLNNYRKEYEHINERIKNIERNYIDNYPELKVMGEFENINSYNKRKEMYLKIREAGLINLNSNLMSELYDVEQKTLQLTNYLEKLKRRQYCRFFSSNNMTLGIYDVNRENFPISIEINARGHSFSLNGNINIPYTIAERFKTDYINSLIKVSYISRIIVNNEENENLLNYEYSDISILYKGGEYKIIGEIQLNKIEKMPATVLREKIK